ncbi:ABC transporter permease [Ruminococcus sp. FC2018]|uniref:ABC transporter permease n=1 Tax=Ruminococcus sp. FC2018 TaxID=1410617 RepID=UPI00068727A5|nr:ABC transporter permease [Ruminococcus sp. FC2018]
MKFSVLLRKELKEMLSVTTIATMFLTVFILIFAGKAMSKAVDEVKKEATTINICDRDQTDFTKAMLDIMDKNETMNVNRVEIGSDDFTKELKNTDYKNVVIIPKGFTAQVEKHETATVKFAQKMTSIATFSNINTGSKIALEMLQTGIKSTIYAQSKLDTGTVKQLEDPIKLEEYTVISDKQDQVASEKVAGIMNTQSMLIPIVMFLLIMYSSQMIMGAISTEKLDKTLETLLSSPVSRLSVISAKMLSAAIVAALQAAVYMFGMNKMMDGITGGMADNKNFDEILQNLGLSMKWTDYLMVGAQMFVTILIVLSVSIILGALAKDAKSAQTLQMPIMFCAMIPYFVTMFIDIKTASPAIKYVTMAIPFTHAFIANQNVMFGDYTTYFIGLGYQFVLLCICMFLALRIFMSDRIFTLTLGGGKKKGGLFKKQKTYDDE